MKKSKAIIEKEKSLQKTVKQMRYEFDAIRKDLKPTVKILEKWITKHIGKRCKNYATGCCVCHAWTGYDIIKGLL